MILKEDIFGKLKEMVLDVLPELDPAQITLSASLRELGANSVDRADILISAMDELSVKVPMVEFAGAANIGEIVEIMHNHS